jgi:hypothetical protein
MMAMMDNEHVVDEHVLDDGQEVDVAAAGDGHEVDVASCQRKFSKSASFGRWTLWTLVAVEAWWAARPLGFRWAAAGLCFTRPLVTPHFRLVVNA